MIVGGRILCGIEQLFGIAAKRFRYSPKPDFQAFAIGARLLVGQRQAAECMRQCLSVVSFVFLAPCER